MKAVRSTALAALVASLAACSYDTNYPSAPPPASPRVDVVFCASAAPKWVALRDGDGEWTRVAPRVHGALASFELGIVGDRAALAVARDFSSNLTTLAIYYGLPAELRAAGDGSAAGCSLNFSRSLAGTVVGLDTNEAATISVDGHAFDFVSPLNGTDFKLDNVAEGPVDLLAARFTHRDGATKLTGIILRHGIQLQEGDALSSIDFSSSENFFPVTSTLTLLGVPGSASQAYGLRTADGGDRILSQTSAVGGSVQQLTAAPENALAPSDLQFVVASAPPIDGTNIVRAVKSYFRVPGDRSVLFGPLPAAPVITIAATTPGLRPSARFTSQAEYNQAAVINYQQGQSTVVSIAMTDAYARGAGGYDLVLPDFSAVTGFESRWTLDALRPVLWTASRIGGTLGLGVNAVPSDGTVVRIASDAGHIITP